MDLKKKELQEMSLERRLATLNISESRVPVPPPRSKKLQKRMTSLPDKMTTTKSPELYGEKSYSFDGDTRYVTSSDNLTNNGYNSHSGYLPSTRPSYSKYEVPRKTSTKNNCQTKRTDSQPMCDIIQSSQQSHHTPHLRRPDILRGSFKADIRSILAETSDHNLYHADVDKNQLMRRPSQLDKNKNIVAECERESRKNSEKRSRSKKTSLPNNISHSRSMNLDSTPRKTSEPMATSTPNMDKSLDANNRFMFYRPKIATLGKQHGSAIGLVGMSEVGYKGSFINPAFDIVDMLGKPEETPTKSKKPIPKPSKPVYSTMGSSFSTRPCTPSPPSQRFRNQKPPLPSPEELKPSPIKPQGPVPLKPMLSAKQLETSLKQYPSQSRVDTSDMCTPQALENMMKYYNMKETDSQSDSPTPPPAKLSAAKKNQSPYSSTGSLNVSGDSIDVVLRRKKKIKIRPLSISSDDESIKRVSLEINLAPNQNGTDAGTNLTGNPQEFLTHKSRTMSQTSLSQSVERLDLDDLTSTETAKLLRKQFAKLKVKANNLKVKDTELKQRFALLQNQRGRVCGHGGGGVTKSKLRSSPILL